MHIIKSDIILGTYTKNVGSLFLNSRGLLCDKPAVAERIGNRFRYWSWERLTQDIILTIDYLLKQGLEPKTQTNNRVAFIAGNNYQRLVCEMAVMSCGLVSVPIFARYPDPLMTELLRFSKVSLLITDVPDEAVALGGLPEKILLLNCENSTTRFGKDHQVEFFEDLLGHTIDGRGKTGIEDLMSAVEPSEMALIMYTSGTSGFPKGVQISHGNLMSQQRALQILWQPEPEMHFLSYLPWHHSFGGLFERFFALHSGGCLVIDDSQGKDIDRLLENFKRVKPHIYFSVPRIYQEICNRVRSSKNVDRSFFHDRLKFVFTAAAPLPISTSDIFKAKGIPVIEGWGLTETSPCCTLTSLDLERQSGVVGFPIPGVELALSDENEILVKGPNVMGGYFRNQAATKKAFTSDGWFRTGDVGDFTPQGVKIVSRKERMFKLDSGEKIFPAELEDCVNDRCCYIKHSYVFGHGQTHPFMLVFPNRECLDSFGEIGTDRYGCARPRHLSALSNCLGKCIRDINDARETTFKDIKQALIIDRELSLENNELTPSFKLVPRRVEEHFSEYIAAMLEQRYDDLPDDAQVIAIEPLPCERLDDDEVLSKAQQVAVENLHYAVIGTGPVGRVLAAHLYKSGHQVSVLCRSKEQKQQLDENPIIVSGALQAEEQLHNIYTNLEQLLSTKPDVVLICTKNVDSADLLEEIRTFHPPDEMLFVSCQNGLDVEDQIIQLFGPGRALRMVLNMGCGMVDENEIRVSFAMRHFISDVAEVNSYLIQQIARDLSSANFFTETDEFYRVSVFKKALLNASLGSICALTRQTMAFVMGQQELRKLIRQMLDEGIRIANAMDLSIGDEFIEEAMAYLDGGGEHKPSILIDIEMGRKTENEYHCGKLVEYARKYGVDVTVIPIVYSLIKTLEIRR
jgi:2-dehydropantoate 2-reductase